MEYENYEQNLNPDHDPSVGMSEGDHHPHKSVLKKVKEKAKKIKDTIKKHSHNHDDDENDEDMVDDPEVHGAPMYDSTAAGVVEPPSPKIKIGAYDNNRAPQIQPSNYQSKANDVGKEANLAPLVSQFDNLNVHKKPEAEQRSSYGDTHARLAPDSNIPEKPASDPTRNTRRAPDSNIPEKPASDPTPNTIAGKISSATSAAAGAAVSAKNAVASKLGYGSGSQEGQDRSLEHSESAEGQQVSSGGTVKGYLAEKLRPGDEDKALSEVITEVFTRKKERVVVEGSRVKESEDVAARLGPAPEKKREGEDALAAGAESSGQGVVERMKDAVGAWLGKGVGLQTAQDSIEGTYVSDPISATDQVAKGEEASGRRSA